MVADSITLISAVGKVQKYPYQQEKGQQHQQASQFTQGQQVTATVKGQGENQQFILLINGLELSARLVGKGPQLQPGQQIQLQVASTAPALVLQEAANDEALARQTVARSLYQLAGQADFFSNLHRVTRERLKEGTLFSKEQIRQLKNFSTLSSSLNASASSREMLSLIDDLLSSSSNRSAPPSEIHVQRTIESISAYLQQVPEDEDLAERADILQKKLLLFSAAMAPKADNIQQSMPAANTGRMSQMISALEEIISDTQKKQELNAAVQTFTQSSNVNNKSQIQGIIENLLDTLLLLEKNFKDLPGSSSPQSAQTIQTVKDGLFTQILTLLGAQRSHDDQQGTGGETLAKHIETGKQLLTQIETLAQSLPQGKRLTGQVHGLVTALQEKYTILQASISPGDQLSSLIDSLLAPQNSSQARENTERLMHMIQSLPQHLPREQVMRNLVQNVQEELAASTPSPARSLFHQSPDQDTQTQAQIIHLLNTLQQYQPTSGQIESLITQLPALLPGTPEATVNLIISLLELTIGMEQYKREQQASPRIEGADVQLVQQQLGLDFEQLLPNASHEQGQTAQQSFKQALLSIASQPGTAAEVSDQITEVIKTIELSQMIQMRLLGDALLFMPLPFPFLQQGYALLEKHQPEEDESKKQKSGVAKLSLFLQLEGLGNITIEVEYDKGSAKVNFRTESTETTQFMARFKEEFQETVQSLHIEEINFFTDAEDPVRHLAALIMKTSQSIIDMQA